jgi:polar amino acid transport system substrate-binding protein
MRAVLEDLRAGEIGTYDVPEPELRSGGILVRTSFSAISAGTERAHIETSEKSLLGKALARPDMVRQVLDFARTNGVKAAYNKVQSRLGTLSSMGYSCAGSVIAVGRDVTDFLVGDRVACGGGGYANHCEINWVPSNLAIRVPASVSSDAASLTTIGSIAVQGLRQSHLNFGETALIVGAGLVGVLTIQLARAAGYKVIAVDMHPQRVLDAEAFGAHLSLNASDPQLLSQIRSFSRYGPDAAIITAASPSADPLELAAKALRDRGRIVVVGSVGMGVSRHDMYHKEITLALSRSYGPGRYDPLYEERGIDYPVGFVRWTERRNMESFLDCLAQGTVNVSRLLEHKFPVDRAAEAYQKIKSGGVYTVLIEYPDCQSPPFKPQSNASTAQIRPSQELRVGCIGAGGFATTHIFPNMKTHRLVRLESVATASGVAAESARRNFGFARTSTPTQLLSDDAVDALFIASRHHSHADYVSQALRRGKRVFVEKPLAVNRDQLNMVREAYYSPRGNPDESFLMVGFNRRFAPFTKEVATFFAGRQEPMIIHIRVNAGFLPIQHWTQQPDEGGRIVGELCHFVDWARYVVGHPISQVSAFALPNANRYNCDNVVANLSFSDGSLANLIYLANGDSSVPKEYFEVFCNGAVARLEDFSLLQLTRNQKTKKLKTARDKGHSREVHLTLEAMIAGKGSPIPFDQLLEVTDATFTIADTVAGQVPQRLRGAIDPLVSVYNDK